MKTHPLLKSALRAATVAVLAIGMTGCILRLTGGFAFTDSLETFVNLIFDDVSVALCQESRPDEEGNTTTLCDYSIETEDGRRERTSTARLLREFGLFGLLVDPLILQVPESASVQSATVTVRGGTAQDLRITETTSFEVTPAVTSNALPGRKFWIVELPLAVETELASAGRLDDLDFQFQYRGPPEPDNVLTVQAMFAGRVEIGTETFYVPLFPCTSNWSDVPDLNIPIADNYLGFIFDLLFLFEDNDVGCQDVVYDFDAVPVNGPPAIVSTPPTAGTENDLYTYDVEAIDPDDDPLAFSLDAGPAGMTIDPVSGLIEWTPDTSQVGPNTVSVRVQDPDGASDSQGFTIDVAPANGPPAIVSTPPTAGTENDLYTYDVEAIDPDDDPLTFSLDAGPAGMTIDPVSGLIEWTPDTSQVGPNTVSVRVQDPDGASDSQGFTVDVAPAAPLRCDVDNDGDVDRDDIMAIFAARNQPAAPGDPRDNDGDGVITVLDARQCVLLCTLPGCASP